MYGKVDLYFDAFQVIGNYETGFKVLEMDSVFHFLWCKRVIFSLVTLLMVWISSWHQQIQPYPINQQNIVTGLKSSFISWLLQNTQCTHSHKICIDTIENDEKNIRGEMDGSETITLIFLYHQLIYNQLYLTSSSGAI